MSIDHILPVMALSVIAVILTIMFLWLTGYLDNKNGDK